MNDTLSQTNEKQSDFNQKISKSRLKERLAIQLNFLMGQRFFFSLFVCVCSVCFVARCHLFKHRNKCLCLYLLRFITSFVMRALITHFRHNNKKRIESTESRGNTK